MIERIDEDQIRLDDKTGIVRLLALSFPGVFGTRIYFKQLPNFRVLARQHGDLIGHVAVIWRAARLGTSPIHIFGVVDLCVADDHRQRGTGSKLVETVIDSATRAGAHFVLAFADDPRLYAKLGFVRRTNPCTWLAIDEHRTLGVKTERLDDCLMSLPIGGYAWDDALDLDLLGHVF